MEKDEIIYYLTIEDLQNVANQEIERNLSLNEVENLKEKIAEKINWYEAICFAIIENIKSPD